MRIVRRLKPDILQGWMYYGNIAASFISTIILGDVKVIWNIRHSVHEMEKERLQLSFFIRLGSLACFKPEKIIYNSAVSMCQHEKLGYDKRCGIVLPNGFDCHKFKPSKPDRIEIRKSLTIDPDSIIIGLIARYHPVKDHENFLTAARILSIKRPDIHFILAGQGVDHHNNKLVSMLNDLNINKQVHLLGEREDIPGITASLDIATVSSWSEAFPNVIGEAMACGTPCVVTDVGDCAKLVGETGIVIPTKNPESLANAWEDLIRMDHSKRITMGKAARQRVLNNFSIDVIAEQYQNLYLNSCVELF